MTNKWIAISVLLGVTLASGALLALDLGQIMPTSATAGDAKTFYYEGTGTPYEWCFLEVDASSAKCQGDNSKFTFEKVGSARVQVKLKDGEALLGAVTQPVEVK